MLVSNRIFMELIERVVKAEQKAADAEKKAAELERKFAILTEKVLNQSKMEVAAEKASSDKETADEREDKILDELLNGVLDDKLGRVKYTDGRE